jgi:multiple sugar transport system substrate-binding protein
MINGGLAAGMIASLVAFSGGVANAKTSAVHDKTTITLAGWASSSAEPADLQKVLNNFEKKYPSIHVNLEEINSNFEQQVETQIAGGGGPDVLYVDQSWDQDLMSAGDLVALNGYAAKDKAFDVGDFASGLLKGFQWKGKQYAYPKDYSALAIQYNKTLLAQAKIKTLPKTWTQFAADACKATNKKKGIYGAVLSPDIARWGPILFAEGGNVLNKAGNKSEIDSKAAVNAVNAWAGLVKKGCARIPTQSEGWGGGSFQTGKVAFATEGNWIMGAMSTAPYNKIKYGTVKFPSVNGKSADWNYAVGYAINKNSKQKAADWTLLSYLTGKTGEKQWVDLFGALPARKSIKPPAHTGAYVAGAQNSRPWQFPSGFFGSSGPYAAINNAMQEAGEGKISAKQAVDNMNTAINQWLEAPH